MTSIEEVRHWDMDVAPKVVVDIPTGHAVQVVSLCEDVDWYL
jgi:hypothetical protein